MVSVFTELEAVLDARKRSSPEESYVASLYSKGLDQILKKVGEECAETIIAAKNKNKSELLYESADLLFHLMVLLRYQDITLKELEDELARRFNVSGHVEKAGRNIK